MWCLRELRIQGLCRTMVPIITMLKQIGANLTSLILSTCVVEEADLATILDVCPHLARFTFYHAVRRCLKPLIEAYASSSGCHVSPLALQSEFVRGAEQEMLDPLLKTLNDPTHPMSQRLRTLRLSNKPFSPNEQQVLSEILQTNSVLEFLGFTGEREVQTLIKSHDGKLMCVTKEGKDSLYEFLLCAKRAAAPLDGVKVLAVECLRLVALFEAQRVRRWVGISYQHDRHDLF